MKKELSKRYDPKQVEDRLYKFWEEKGYFKPNNDRTGKSYTIMMPPPNVTGQLHMGHAFDETLQDFLVRYHRMLGDKTLWLPGMDHASIATEVKVADQVWEDQHKTKEEIGRDEFLDITWDWSNKYRDRIRDQIKKLGASCDWSRERFTMDENLSNAVKESFSKLYEDGKIYKGSRIINWCPSCQTALSDAEVEYEEQAGKLWYIKYPIKDSSEFITVATTRPETMLGDTAIAVNPEDTRFSEFIGKTAILPLVNREIPIIEDEYVDTTFGTGAVKITPAHDPNDYEIGLRHNLEEINIMNDDGSLNENAGENYQGLDRFEAREKVVEDLNDLDLIEKIEDLNHNVGTCYRCHTTIENLTSEQWFVAMQELADKAIKAVQDGRIKFIPERFTKVFYNWMENIKDWCISRQLWWGHRIPVYYCPDCGEVIVSKDKVETCPHCNSTNIVQEEDVLDTWFSSALWPFSTLGWPEETKDLKDFFPGSTLITGYDIIFFWVARMIFMSLYNMKDIPFENVYIHGLIRDAEGRKMSKSLGNGIDPLQVIEDYSADALRFAILMGNSAGNDVRMTNEKLEWGRNFLNKLWNAARFILSNYDIEINEEDLNLEITDYWILSKANQLIEEATENIDKFEFGLALQKVYDFAWNEFCDWYLEFTKPRLYGSDAKSKEAALYTLVNVLETILKLLHPAIPFITEEIYSSIPGNEEKSLIIEEWPVSDGKLYPKEEESVEYIKDIVRAVRNLRKQFNIPNKKEIKLYFTGSEEHKNILEDNIPLLKKLVNIAEIKELPSEADRKSYASEVIGSDEVFVSLDSIIDKEKEKAKLEGQLSKLQGQLKKVEGKLNNKGFIEKAPQAVIEKERNKQSSILDEIKAIENRLLIL